MFNIMPRIIAIRMEGRSTERRTPLVPNDAASLIGQGLNVLVQRSPIRIHSAAEYEAVGARVVTELGNLPRVIFGLKEMPVDMFKSDTTYVCFSHVTKGQPSNMHMLRTMMERGATIIDYEEIVNQQNQRIVAFGNFAGMAGIVDTMNLLGLRFETMGYKDNPFSQVKQTIQYRDGLAQIKEELTAVGDKIRSGEVPGGIGPIVFGFLGYGRVGKGAVEVFDALNPVQITPFQLLNESAALSKDQIYKVIFTETDVVSHIENGSIFENEDYWKNPKSHELYKPILAPQLPNMTALINCIVWNPNQPVLITQKDLQRAAAGRLRVIGDITCDIFPQGAVVSTVKSTTVTDPYFVYDPENGQVTDGFAGRGIGVMAVDTLPTELPIESSAYFSSCLLPFVPGIANADYDALYNIGILSLPEEVRPAVILWRGQLTPRYAENRSILEGLKLYGNQPFSHDW